jgi:Mor family transcriptional regulator
VIPVSNNLDWVIDLSPADLPEPLCKIANLIGVRNAVILSQNYGGITFYLPKTDAALRMFRDKRIKAEFNGYNYKELAIKYGITEMWVRNIVAGHDKETGQMNLLEMTGNL